VELIELEGSEAHGGMVAQSGAAIKAALQRNNPPARALVD
jgi:hypothetical protein